MTLGDGFSKRKELQSEFMTWINRLRLSGMETTTYRVEDINDKEDKALPGSLKKFTRIYSVEECLEKLKQILKEDRELALRISLTNQQAKATMIDLEGKEVELTIPELIVLKNEISPKLEEIERNIPTRAKGVEILEDDDDHIKWREIQVVKEKEREITDKGFQRDIIKIKGYNMKEYMDYGYTERSLCDRTDAIRAWQTRLKEAINEANKTPLVNLGA